MIQWLFMGWGALAFTTVFYLVQAGAYGFMDRPPMILVFVGYAIANIGLIWDVIRQGA